MNGATPSSPGQFEAGSAVVPTTSATFPPVDPLADSRLILPVASGVGNAAPTAPPDASWTRKYCPGAIVPEVMFVLFEPNELPVPANWIEYGVNAKSIVVVPLLKISTKSFL